MSTNCMDVKIQQIRNYWTTLLCYNNKQQQKTYPTRHQVRSVTWIVQCHCAQLKTKFSRILLLQQTLIFNICNNTSVRLLHPLWILMSRYFQQITQRPRDSLYIQQAWWIQYMYRLEECWNILCFLILPK